MPTPSDLRPSPDALLAEARRDQRGHLKIFLGAAPGVGKTFAMLSAAHEKLRAGVDVLAGVIEHHGRPETRALLDGLPLLPLKEIHHRGRSFAEMDLDGLLHRRPALALIDEFAHSNVPGSRHLKRWQDVQDLLEAGIDVYTTLNIQHLEGLNDVVERITGIKVRETVPDSVFAAADAIELIDLPPDDLIRRLQDGKVYVPDQARRAMHHFFSPATLTSLREMALRHAAERVDRQMVDYMRAHAISGPWPSRERVMVCLGTGEEAERLVRIGKRSAERRGSAWSAVTVETPGSLQQSPARQAALEAALRLAEQLGAETRTLHGTDVVTTLLEHARTTNVTLIVTGRPPPGPWSRLWPGHRPLADRLIAGADDINILVVPPGETKAATPPPTTDPVPPFPWTSLLLTVGTTGGATLLGGLIDHFGLPLANISVAYLMAVLLVAIRAGQTPAILTSLASFFCFNFFFTEPRYTFAITDSQNILTIVFFLLAAVIVSKLAARLRTQVDRLRENARRTETLYAFGRTVSAAVTQDDVLWAVAHHVATTLHGRSLVLMPQDGSLKIAAGYPPEDRLDDTSAAAADWAWTNDRMAGRGTATLPAAGWLFLPMKTGRGAVGILGVRQDSDHPPAPDLRQLLDMLADQAAIAIERTMLVGDIETARVATERERLRAALLSSLSHDLRTPLVSIMGAASSLITYGPSLTDPQRTDLSQTIQDEAERLNRFVQNLLDMTRLEAGALKPKTDWVDLHDIIEAARRRAERLLGHHTVRIALPPDLPLVCVDPVLMEQVVFNLLDNARKYAPPGSVITVWAGQDGRDLRLEVSDQGPGIPPEDRERVFDMFYRVDQSDRLSGTGLGLAICRGIVTAHGGTLRADSGLNGVGASLILRLPMPEATPGVPA